ncbi:MAG TPA: AIR synthase related protein, partial [Acidimicrobiales bacterium]|nr:AIR synthase related protein [Acidimicrobiales bacterium]
DAALLRLAAPGLPPSERGLALTTDSKPAWCSLDPRTGTAATVAESVLNLACVGARAVAVVNCLNFGNPEHAEVMWQLSESVDGMAEACLALGTPVVGGNVSLYNESGGRDIDPTPVIGALGLVDRLVAAPPGTGLVTGSTLVLLDGQRAPRRAPLALAGSRWAVECRAHRNGTPPALDLDAHLRLVELVRDLVSMAVAGGEGIVDAVHDVSGGGLAVCVAEMVVAAGAGCRIAGVADHRQLFTEAPSRVVVATTRPDELVARARVAAVDALVLGEATGDRLVVEGLVDLSVAEVRAAFESRLPRLLDELAPAVADDLSTGAR